MDSVFETINILFSRELVALIVYSFMGMLIVFVFMAPLLNLNLYPSKLTVRFRRGKAVVGYKVAYLEGNGFTGISGGAYGYSEKGRLNPGFHCFRDMATLMGSDYAHSGTVILEVLIYGKVIEFEDGYIGSNQRVLQVAPNRLARGQCRLCNSAVRELLFDTESTGEYGLICSTCALPAKAANRFVGWFKSTPKEQSRFIPLGKHFELANGRSGNEFPVGYVSWTGDLVPTVIPADSSAR